MVDLGVIAVVVLVVENKVSYDDWVIDLVPVAPAVKAPEAAYYAPVAEDLPADLVPNPAVVLFFATGLWYE
jgi:hypothetical protein